MKMKQNDVETILVKYFGKRWRGTIKFYVFIVFICLGVLFYHTYEDWNLVDCLFFSIVTGFTVGYGSPSPDRDISRLFTVFFILGSMVFVFESVNDFARFLLSRVEKRILRSKARERNVYTYDTNFISRTAVTRGKLKAAVFFLLFTILLGTVYFIYNEEWSFVTALYFIISTISTVGYGELRLQHESSKMFLMVYIPVAVTLFVTSFALLSVLNRQLRIDRHRDKILGRPMDKYWIHHIRTEHAVLLDQRERERDRDREGAKEGGGGGGVGVDKFAFVTSSLLDLGLVELHDIEPLIEKFRQLDPKGTGHVHAENDDSVNSVLALDRLAAEAEDGDGERDGPYGTFKVDHTLSLLYSLEDAASMPLSPSMSLSGNGLVDQRTPLLSARDSF